MTTEAFLGILSLDTAFPRIAGDVGNPGSYPFPARVAVVPGADAPAIVRDGPLPDATLAIFETAARRLEAEGAAALVSTCGFLVTAQARIAAAVRVPVMLSGLSLIPMAQAACGGRVGVLTASGAALGAAAFDALGVAPGDVAVAGLEDVPAFAATFLAPKHAQPATLDRDAIEAGVVAAARSLVVAHPDLTAFVLECGNLPPYAGAVREATGLPVFHLLDAAALLMAAGGPPA